MKSTSSFDHSKIEGKWQKKWFNEAVYSPDMAKSKRPFYNLMMFPYPSAEGLHAGNMFAFTGSDVYGRFTRMIGYDVFEPIGLDGFGIHSENYAIKIGSHPMEQSKKAEIRFYDQLQSIGAGFDWKRRLETYDPDYYRWTQWIFVELFKAGLAYRKKAEVNWCPSCKTVLADEQVMTPAQAGKVPPGFKSVDEVPEGTKVCERCANIVERKELEQWFFRITDYADRLLSNLDKINWSERVKVAQKNWIGRSEGMLITFETTDGGTIEVFTTRPDTLNAATFIAVSDDTLYNKYRESKEKFGEFTDRFAINPLTGDKLPIWKTNYVASGYGTGAIMGVPAHDERDLEFAKKYEIDVVKKEPDEKLWKLIPQKKWGKAHKNYHLRDWLISRQRYWGPPIPMIYCESCAEAGKSWFSDNKGGLHKDQTDWNAAGWYPEDKLPVELPKIDDYQPKGSGRGPLAAYPEFYETKCPGCGDPAKRETDVSDTFLDSAWYFLRYPSVDSKSASTLPFDTDVTKKWLPVNQYFGGAEHAVLHLMYSRFITMVLHDLDKISFEEPFPNFYAHGLVIKDGAKMSKSRGNVVNPDEYIKKFGADTLRLYLMFMGPMDSYPDFRDAGIEGMYRFVRRIYKLYDDFKSSSLGGPEAARDSLSENRQSNIKMHQTIEKVTKDVQNFHYNTAISAIMEYVNTLKEYGAGRENLKVLAQLIAPFAPHLAEEVWVEVLGEKFSVHRSSWPTFDPKVLVNKQIDIIIQVNGKVRGQISVESDKITKEEIEELAKNDEKVAKWLAGGKIKKTIYVPGKIVNFVING